jgi:hypothetical protein
VSGQQQEQMRLGDRFIDPSPQRVIDELMGWKLRVNVNASPKSLRAIFYLTMAIFLSAGADECYMERSSKKSETALHGGSVAIYR